MAVLKSLLYVFTQCCTCVLCRLLHTRPICDRGPNDMDLVSPHIRQVDSVLVSLYWMLARALDHFKNLLYVVVTHCYILVPGKPQNSRPRCDRGSNALGFMSPHIGILKLIFKHGSLIMDRAEGRLEVHTSPSLNSGYLFKMRGLTHIKVYGGQVCALRWYLHWG